MRLLDRARLDDDIGEPPALPVMGEPALCRPGLADHLHRLVEPLGRFFGRDAEPRELVAPVTLADTEIQPAIRQQIECGRLLGDEDRVVPWQDDDGGAEANALGARRQVTQQAHRRRHLAEPGEMVFDQENARKAEPLGFYHIMDEVMIGVAVASRAAAGARPAEQSEFHARPPSDYVRSIYLI